VASGQANESKVADVEQDFDDFDAAGDLCDFGFVLAPPPVQSTTENRTEASR
jgi:hypothetical protein